MAGACTGAHSDEEADKDGVGASGAFVVVASVDVRRGGRCAEKSVDSVTTRPGDQTRPPAEVRADDDEDEAGAAGLGVSAEGETEPSRAEDEEGDAKAGEEVEE